MKRILKREFTTRNFLKKREATKKARTLIDKKKYYGVKVNITKYQKDIKDHFYDTSLFDKIFKVATNLSTKASQYLFETRDYTELLKKAKEVLSDSFKKGSKRVLDNSGGTVKLDEPIDETSVDLLTNQQVDYYQNLSENQSRKIDRLIADGYDEGKTDEQITVEIKSSVKDISTSSARRIARSEIVKSHSIAQVQTMQQAGIDEYNYITANDKKVSKICRKNQGSKGREKIYKTAQAGTPSNPLPVINSHPNCRCVAVAYIK